MAVQRPLNQPNSIIAVLIKNDIKKFIKDNAAIMENRTGDPVDDAAESLAGAIAFGISKALSTAPVNLAFQAGIAPPGGGPVGSLIYTPLSNAAREV